MFWRTLQRLHTFLKHRKKFEKNSGLNNFLYRDWHKNIPRASHTIFNRAASWKLHVKYVIASRKEATVWWDNFIITLNGKTSTNLLIIFDRPRAWCPVQWWLEHKITNIKNNIQAILKINITNWFQSSVLNYNNFPSWNATFHIDLLYLV